MTNFEKYKDEMFELINSTNRVAVVNGKPISCYNTKCNKCLFYGGELGYCDSLKDLIKWLYKEYKEPAPTLTSKERAFCEVVNNFSNRRIARPIGSSYTALIEDEVVVLSINSQWFEFIKDGENWSIEDLLKLEVQDND